MRVKSVLPHPYVQPAGEGKVCGGCKMFCSFDEFSWNKNNNGLIYRSSRCKLCKATSSRAWNKKHKHDKLLNCNLRRQYGLTLEQYNEMVLTQDGLCAICKKPPSETGHNNHRLHVDHCHTTGKVRSLLCSTCNNGIGCFKENPDLLMTAAAYLVCHASNQTS